MGRQRSRCNAIDADRFPAARTRSRGPTRSTILSTGLGMIFSGDGAFVELRCAEPCPSGMFICQENGVR